MPELLILGDYNPEKLIGPAIWLRCVIAGKVEEASSLLEKRRMPLLLCLFCIFPGVSRQDLRAKGTSYASAGGSLL
jgi:hypothetical protein